ncbi:MAG: ATP-dependent Clp protease ATP-binding subunit [Candidatus Pacebacteria bacterium]|nr:ATP-dependent Clp protease ATP-binding subunit [Candidatus Paceibacterota bacterium]
MTFDLKRTAIYKAVKWADNPLSKGSRPLIMWLVLVAIALTIIFIQGVLLENLTNLWLDRLLGVAILTFLWGILFWQLNAFLETSFKKPKLNHSLKELLNQPADFNAADFLDYQAAQAFKKAGGLKGQNNSSSALLLSLINQRSELIKFVFARAGLIEKAITKELKDGLGKTFPSENWQLIIIEAGQRAVQTSKERIGVGDLLIVLSGIDDVWQKFLLNNDLTKNDIGHLVNWYERALSEWLSQKRFWDLTNLKKRGSLARDWAFGYTLTLDRFIGIDYVAKAQRTGFRKIIGHESEIKEVERILSKTSQNCVLLVGEAGVGRKSIIEAIAQKSFFSASTKAINDKRVIQFDISLLASSTDSQEEAESALDLCFAEAVRAGNIILIIDNLHQFTTQERQAGIMNITAILSRYLPLQSFKLIGLTTYEGLHQVLEKNPSLLNQFEKVEVGEISSEEALILLENFYVPNLELKLKKMISYKALRSLVNLSVKYMPQIPLPDKAVRLLDEASTYLNIYTKESVLEERHIRKVITEKTQIPLEDLQKQEKEKLLNLEKLLGQRIIGQKEAIGEISSALRRAKAEVKTKKGPMGSFLFLGPTGVGKTETAKALAAIYFGSEQKMIRLDMTEFQNPSDIARLLGTPEEGGLLTVPVRESPFSLVLLDEIEKAHPNILNLFLQVLDEGLITDGVGKKVNFQNTIIIATSNAGAELIREDIADDTQMDIVKTELLDKIFKENIFRPEFINRFDGVVVFHSLSQDDLLQIAQLLLKQLANQLRDKGIVLAITKPLKEKIVSLSYNPAFGAREMKRVIQNKVENILADAILKGAIKRGDIIELSPNDFAVVKLNQ